MVVSKMYVCHVKNCSFIPNAKLVNILKKKCLFSGSSWQVNADEATTVTVTGYGLTLARVNQHSIIEIRASGGYAEGYIQAQVTGKHYY